MRKRGRGKSKRPVANPKRHQVKNGRGPTGVSGKMKVQSPSRHEAAIEIPTAIFEWRGKLSAISAVSPQSLMAAMGGKRTLGRAFGPDAKLVHLHGLGGRQVCDGVRVQSEHRDKEQVQLRHAGAVGLDFYSGIGL